MVVGCEFCNPQPPNGIPPNTRVWSVAYAEAPVLERDEEGEGV